MEQILKLALRLACEKLNQIKSDLGEPDELLERFIDDAARILLACVEVE